jgi:hypothetical protein
MNFSLENIISLQFAQLDCWRDASVGSSATPLHPGDFCGNEFSACFFCTQLFSMHNLHQFVVLPMGM